MMVAVWRTAAAIANDDDKMMGMIDERSVLRWRKHPTFPSDAFKEVPSIEGNKVEVLFDWEKVYPWVSSRSDLWDPTVDLPDVRRGGRDIGRFDSGASL